MGVVLEFDKVSKRFRKGERSIEVLDSVSLSLGAGEFVAAVGPSGCGKSTLLNLAGGLLLPDGGEVRYDGRRIEQVNTAVGYVTQRDTLLPWRTVRGNVGVALELRGVPRTERALRVTESLERVGLADVADHYPSELSGGMRKRVGLARTMVYEPRTVLMDEPFGDLDAQLKLVLQLELLRLWERSRQTILFVTHDLEEAISLADRVVVLSARPGRVEHIEVIDLPRPRDVLNVRFLPRFSELYRSLWGRIEADVRRSATSG